MKRFRDAVEARLLAQREAALASTPAAELDRRAPRGVPEPMPTPPGVRKRITTGVRNAIVRAAKTTAQTQSEIAAQVHVARRTVIRVLKAAGLSPGQGRLGVKAW